MLTLGWSLAAPIVSVLIGLIILVASFRLLRDATNVLLEGSPRHIDPADLRQAVEALPRVLGVHDLHTWTITSGYYAMSAHILLREPCSREEAGVLLSDLRRLVRQRYR